MGQQLTVIDLKHITSAMKKSLATRWYLLNYCWDELNLHAELEITSSTNYDINAFITER